MVFVVLQDAIPTPQFRLSMVRVIISSHELIHISIVVGGNTLKSLQSHEGAGRYINAFQAPFQELSPLSSQEVYALQACFLLVICPPPPGRAAPQGGFPTDLVEINLSDWASLVQDVAAGLQVLPPGLSNCLDPKVITLLQWLEAVTQVRFCRLCYYLDTNCRCAGVPLSTPLTSWSQIMEWTPGYGMTASSGGVTTLSTSLRGVTRLVPPPPGISICDTFPWKAPIPQQLVTTPSYRPPVGSGEWLKTTLSMRAPVPQVPQVARAIRQLPPLSWGQPATLYQQVVQPQSKTSGLRVTFDSSATKPASPGSQDIDVHGRQVTQGQDSDRRSASHPGRGWEGSSIRETSNRMPQQDGGCPTGAPRNIPPSSTPGKPSPQSGDIMKASPRNPLKNLANYRSAGWRKDLDHILGSFYHYNYPSRKEEEWKKLRTKFFEYLGQHQEE